MDYKIEKSNSDDELNRGKKEEKVERRGCEGERLEVQNSLSSDVE